MRQRLEWTWDCDKDSGNDSGKSVKEEIYKVQEEEDMMKTISLKRRSGRAEVKVDEE